MSGRPFGFDLLYASALEAHLVQSGEPALHQAYELGRQALAEGLGVLDLTLLHHDVLARLLLDAGEFSDEARLALAAEFLAECLSPFEMTLRGYREANARLGEANAELRKAHEAREATHVRLLTEIEERRKAEAALLNAQKLQAVGLLAGGVAHHFNNLLTVVLGNIELARRHAEGDPRLASWLHSARRGAERGADITRQLLSFSRQQMLQPRPVDLGAWLADLKPLLASALRGDIDVEAAAAAPAPQVMVDPGQLELAILNLALNARDAMPDGGVLRIAAWQDPGVGAAPTLSGEFVTIEVSDTGQGVPPEVLPRVFEPFFTTKNGGPGSGLGLSQVHGFAHQSGGAVEMESQPGRGTIVRLYLPAVPADVQPVRAPAPTLQPATRHGSLLVVEDDVELARLAAELLESFGYGVKVAYRAKSALDLLRRGEPVDLLFSDVVLPGGMNGFELARAVRRERPALPVLLTSGYSDAFEAMQGEGLAFIVKPYRSEDLRLRIGDLLSSARTHPRS